MDDDTLAASLTGLAGNTSAGTDRCKVGRILDTVNDTNRATITELLTARDTHGRHLVGDHDLAARLRRGGQPIGHTAIYLHRRGDCLCGDNS